MHKFILGQQVSYHAARGLYAAAGAYVVTAKLPERDGQFEYRIWNRAETHERMARESDLAAITADDRATGGSKGSSKLCRGCSVLNDSAFSAGSRV
jgi:hypothetical protein